MKGTVESVDPIYKTVYKINISTEIGRDGHIWINYAKISSLKWEKTKMYSAGYINAFGIYRESSPTVDREVSKWVEKHLDEIWKSHFPDKNPIPYSTF